MYVLSNIASGNEFHKEAVMRQLLLQVNNGTQAFILKFLQSNDSQLRTAAIWTIINLTFPSSPGASSRVVKLRNAGIVSQIKTMVNDPCVDVKVINLLSQTGWICWSFFICLLSHTWFLFGVAPCKNSTWAIYDYWWQLNMITLFSFFPVSWTASKDKEYGCSLYFHLSSVGYYPAFHWRPAKHGMLHLRSIITFFIVMKWGFD